MHITFVSIFPEIYESFFATSLIKKAQERGLLTFALVNPRDFCSDKHKQVDDEIYGGGAGMLMKAQPVIDAVESALRPVAKDNKSEDRQVDKRLVGHAMRPVAKRKVIFLSPSQIIFNQQLAYEYSELDHIILVSGRYEGIDYRFEQYMTTTYPDNFLKLSLGQFVTLGGETPSLVLTEAIVRLIPGVIKEEASHLIESYDPQQSMQNLEYPQYTRPEQVEGFNVPEVLLSGNHKQIEQRRHDNTFNS